jgi:tricorn protease
LCNYGVKEQRLLENFQLEPDVRITLPYDAFINGRDTQIEKAVEEMLKEIGK